MTNRRKRFMVFFCLSIYRRREQVVKCLERIGKPIWYTGYVYKPEVYNDKDIDFKIRFWEKR